jgi:hypothetical protein
MKTIHLSALKLDVEVPDNVHYHDDGLVRGLAMHSAELANRYSEKRPDNFLRIFVEMTNLYSLYHALAKSYKLPVNGGRCLTIFPGDSIIESITRGDQVHSHIFVLDNLTPHQTIFAKGHEETHFLGNINRFEELQKVLKINQKNLIELPQEAVCDIGGLYAVIKNFPEENLDLGFTYEGHLKSASEWLRQNSHLNFKKTSLQ